MLFEGKTVTRHRSFVSPIAARLVCATLLIVVLQLLLSNGNAQVTGGRYADPQYGYSLDVPPGWIRKTDIPRPYVAFLGPVANDYQSNFSIYTEPAANKSLAQFVKVARNTVAKTKSVRLQKSGPTKLGGRPAALLQTLVTVNGSEQSVARQILAVHKGRCYTLTFITRPADLKVMSPVFTRVISSFKWQ